MTQTEVSHSPNKKSPGKKTTSSVNYIRSFAIGLIIPALLLIIWEVASRAGIFPQYLLPAPSAVLSTLVALASSGELWTHVSSTLSRVLIGFFLGTVIAVVLGSFIGFFKPLERLFDPLLQALRSIPSLAWVPLFILWMGIAETSKVTLIAVGVFFPVYLNIVSGIQGVDRKLIEVGKVYNMSTASIITRIVLPASLPSFLVGLRSGLGLGWMFVVAAELMGASEGLGFLLTLGQNTSRPDTILASIILFAILGKATDAILKQLENRSLRWQDRYET
ncbi:ABC transporter permease [Bacillaceae bacterium JMAK1]|nr:ABC transporter permease [Bacillaceae bacterium JMAK1]